MSRPRRKYYRTSIALSDKKVWKEFVGICRERGLIVSVVLEELIKKWIVANKKGVAEKILE